MKNPFVKKQDHTFLIASIAVGALAAGAVAYLFLTDDGADNRKKLERTIKKSFKKAAADVVEQKTILSKKTAKVVADHLAN
ncbi:hypothetical protein [Mucilaginibacter ginsenosidivorax]|uniref:YtxH domain-containing protein n=1 Tax=Mucilaginibacter ginsenosidivorax TaxID=862126 RepID=A0A5B8W915_9SPHI|nr:hypothetical protein [Mucilaginibacter ginsenosidivorax]QEC79455.1 hypothetical protein FSB76_27185 [Mucilaginibacter ginsenosidivorax]